jgi:hypothetical protein
MTVAEALARAAAGELTTDAALATLDFAVRHRFIEPEGPATGQTSAGATLSSTQWQDFETLRHTSNRAL